MFFTTNLICSHKRNTSCQSMMLKSWLFHLLLFQAVVNVALPLPIVSSTTSSSSSVSSVLTPPANLSECLESNYCNNGACVLIMDPILFLRVSCTCNEPFVDSEAGLCTIEGKSRKTAFIIRCFPVFFFTF